MWCGNGPLNPKISTPPSFIAPTKTFSSALDITIAGIAMKLMHVPSAAADQVAVFLPQSGILLSSEVIPAQHFPALNTLRGEAFRNPVDWYQSIDALRRFRANAMVPSHGVPAAARWTPWMAEAATAVPTVRLRKLRLLIMRDRLLFGGMLPLGCKAGAGAARLNANGIVRSPIADQQTALGQLEPGGRAAGVTGLHTYNPSTDQFPSKWPVLAQGWHFRRRGETVSCSGVQRTCAEGAEHSRS